METNLADQLVRIYHEIRHTRVDRTARETWPGGRETSVKNIPEGGKNSTTASIASGICWRMDAYGMPLVFSPTHTSDTHASFFTLFQIFTLRHAPSQQPVVDTAAVRRPPHHMPPPLSGALVQHNNASLQHDSHTRCKNNLATVSPSLLSVEPRYYTDTCTSRSGCLPEPPPP